MLVFSAANFFVQASPAHAIGCSEPPTVVTLPTATISGDGTSIATTDGVWDTHGCQVEISYNWYRQGFLLGDETEFEYLVIPSADEGNLIYAEVTATNENDQSSSALSNIIDIPPGHGPCDERPPWETQSAGVEGEAEVTGTLTIFEGAWQTCNYAVAGYRFQWLRNGQPIAGETEQSYVPSAADLGQALSARVIAVSGWGESDPSTTNSLIIGPEPPPDETPVYGPPLGSGTVPCIGSFNTTCGPLPEGNEIQFGGLFLERPQGDIRGLRGPMRARHHFYLPDFSIAVMRVAVQAGDQLVQAGYGRSADVQVGNCTGITSNGKLQHFRETLGPGPVEQQCRFFGSPALGKSQLYTVYRKRVIPPGGGNTYWQTNVNGIARNVRFMGFEGATEAIAGGEIQGLLRPGAEWPDGSIHACFGCGAVLAGVKRWQRTSIAGARGWVEVTDAGETPPGLGDGRWEILNYPGKFTVRHRCDPQHRYGC